MARQLFDGGVAPKPRTVFGQGGGGGSFAKTTKTKKAAQKVQNIKASRKKTTTSFGYGGGGGSFPKAKTAPKTAPEPRASFPRTTAPAPAPAPAPYRPGNYSGGVTASTTGAYTPAATGPQVPAVPSLDDFIKSDDVYLTEKAGIDKTLQGLLNELALARTNYDVDFGKTLRNLGWSAPQGARAANAGPLSIDDILSQGQWDESNRLGAFGMSTYNNVNDFAGRGLMQSSFYQRALEDLLSSFEQQRGDLVDARGQFLADSGRQEEQGRAEAELALARARQSAAARRALQYQL